MNAVPPKPPAPADRRRARLEQELRANLLKRKQLARVRRDEAADPAPGVDQSPSTASSPLPPGPRSD